MTHIEQMIQDMCPNGVEFKTLGEVCEMKRGSTITANQAEDGDIPVIAGGQKPAYFHNQSNREGKNITVAGSGAYAGYVAYWEQPIFVSDAFTVTPKEAFLDIKFVYYFLTNIQDKIYHTKKGSGVPHVHPSSIADFEIPLPPLEIQKKIVECLDKFSALAAELQAELQMRRKQYEYYRTHLLTPHSDCNSATKSDDCNWEWKTLGELCVSIKDGMHNLPASSLEETDYPIISAQNIFDNKIDYIAKRYVEKATFEKENKRTNVEVGDVLLTIVATIGRSAVVTDNRPVLLQRSVCVLKPSEKIYPKFLKYSLDTNRVQSYMLANAHGAAQAGLYLNQVEQIKIALPPLKEQKRIADLLEKFDKLITSMEDGIPAEQAAQQKRYEYYRDLLLTFDRKVV